MAGSNGDSAEIILDLLWESLRYREASGPTEHAARPGVSLGAEFEAALYGPCERARSAGSYTHYRHVHDRLVKAQADSEHLLADDLFSEETWRLFGLNTGQLVVAAGASGALAGAGADMLAAGHSLGLFALIGGALGAGGALVAGKQRPELSVDVRRASRLPRSFASILPARFQLSGRVLVVGPYQAINFPWILLDRAIGVFSYVVNRAHARRDEVTLRSTVLQPALERHAILTGRWPEEDRKAWERFFAAIRKDKVTREQRKCSSSAWLTDLKQSASSGSISTARRRAANRSSPSAGRTRCSRGFLKVQSVARVETARFAGRQPSCLRGDSGAKAETRIPNV